MNNTPYSIHANPDSIPVIHSNWYPPVAVTEKNLQYAQILRQVDAVLAHQLAIDPHLTAAVFRPVALDQIPVNAGPVAVVTAREIVAGAQGHMHGSAHLLVKKSLVYNTLHIGAGPHRKLAYVAAALIQGDLL